MKFYKRDPDAALVGMTGLTLPERGAYNTIIDLLYSHDGVVPDNDEMLRQACGCHGNEWRSVKVKLILKGKIWVTEDGYLKAKRVDSTIEEAANFSETQRKRVGNRWENERKRLGKTEKHEQLQSGADTSAVLPSIATPTPTPIKKDIARKKDETEKEQAFSGCYEDYPKHKSKAAAKKAYFAALKRGHSPEVILEGLERAKRSDPRFRDIQFTPYPASWLNADGFLDDDDGTQKSFKTYQPPKGNGHANQRQDPEKPASKAKGVLDEGTGISDDPEGRLGNGRSRH